MQKESIAEDSQDNSLFQQREHSNHYTHKQKEAAKDLKITLLNRALCFITKGFYNKAIKDSQRVLELDSHNDRAKFFICLSYIEMNEIVTAEKYLPLNSSLHIVYEKKKREIEELKTKFFSYDKYLFFIKTLYSHDAYFPKIDIKFITDNQRGVFSKTLINKNEIVMSIPKDCLISLDLALSTPIGQEISKFMYLELKSPKHCLLATFLLTEKDNPKWKFYFDMLPNDFSNFPIYYGIKELELLEKTAFACQLDEKIKEIKKDYETLVKLIPSYHQITFNKFCEARMLISSRIFGIKMNNKKTDILAPYADLLNHKRPNQTHWYYDEITKAFLIRAMKDIPQGEELYDSYGIKGNSRFLMHYGFTLEDNDSNEYPLKISLESTAPFFQEKELCIKNTFGCKRTFIISYNTLSSQFLDMFSFLRFIQFKGNLQVLFLTINQGQTITMNNNFIQSFYSITPISLENEQDVLNLLKEICLKELAYFPTTIEEDQRILDHSTLSFNERNCIIIRISEKKVLRFYIEMCDLCLKLLQLSEKELIQTIISDTKYELFENYVQDVIWLLCKKNKKDAKTNSISLIKSHIIGELHT